MSFWRGVSRRRMPEPIIARVDQALLQIIAPGLLNDNFAVPRVRRCRRSAAVRADARELRV
ncbi:MAG TPA: hypothetical protein VNR11_04015 [Xanthobacteraceae bacterium]|nr:hypothetical protein [Xanthobacteraceae bacterium]